MTIDTLPRPTMPGPVGTDEDLIHLWCCDENVALCGVDLAGEVVSESFREDDICPLCRLVDNAGGSCGAAGCPDE